MTYWRGQGFCNGLFLPGAPKVLIHYTFISVEKLSNLYPSHFYDPERGSVQLSATSAVLLLPVQTVRCVLQPQPSALLHSCLLLCMLSAIRNFLPKESTCSWFYWILRKLLVNDWKLKVTFGEDVTDSRRAFRADRLKLGQSASVEGVAGSWQKTDRAPVH